MSEETSTAAEVFTPFEFDVLDITKEAQNQHGLRQSDYQRYRSYCSNRIKKIRSTLEVQKGKSKKYKPFNIDETVKDQRVIMLVLFSAERAWSYSMELKEEITDEPRKRIHMINRLKKAAKHSEQLERICSNGCCEEKTIKSIVAYSKWMKGLLAVEQQKWKEALASLSDSKKIYEEISKTGKAHQVALCNSRIEEIDVPTRYCQYKLGMISLGEESKKSNEESSQMGHIEWLGKRVPLKNENIREFLIDAQLKEVDLKKASNKKDNEAVMQLFDKIIMCYSDALKCSKQDIKTNEEATAKAKSAKGDEILANLKMIDSYLTFTRLTKVVERNTRLAIEKESQLENPLLKSTSEGKARPEDLIKLYDTILQHWQEANSLYGVEQNAKISQEIESKILMNKAFKCFFSAVAFEFGGKWQEAHSLYEKANDYLAKSKQSYKDCEPLKDDMKKDMEELSRLEKNIRARKSSVRASSFLESQESKDDSTQVNDTLWEAIQSHDNSQPIASELVDFQNQKIVTFPPSIEPIALKPFFFDMAGSTIDYPDLSSRTKAKTGGITGYISSFWGRK